MVVGDHDDDARVIDDFAALVIIGNSVEWWSGITMFGLQMIRG